jgi:PAS domain S-box-containing protein
MSRVKSELALRIAGTFFIYSALYILLSDWLLGQLVKDAAALPLWSAIKGLGYIVIIAIILYIVVQKEERKLREAEERSTQSAELQKRLNRALRILSECNQVIAHAVDENTLLQTICQVLVNQGNYRMAWVGYAEHDAKRSVRPVASAGYPGDYLYELDIEWADTERGRGPTGESIRTGQPIVIRNVREDQRLALWREYIDQHGYASLLALPLRKGELVFGALTISSYEVDAFDDQEVRLLADLAEDLAFGIQSLRAVEEQRRAEGALVESEERFRLAFEFAPVGILMTSTEGRFLRANREICQILGYTQEEITARSFRDITHPDDLGISEQAFQDILVGKIQSFDQEKRYVRKDGQSIWVQVRSTLLRQPDHTPLYLITHVQNIHARKLAEEKLKASEANYRALFDQAVDCILIADAQGKLLDANHAACQLLDYLLEEMFQLRLDDLIELEEQQNIERMIQDLSAGKTLINRYRLRRKDHHYLPAEVSFKMLPDGRIQAIARDLRQRERAERELREQKEMFQEILENLPVAIALFSSDGQLTWINSSLERILGYTLEDAVQADFFAKCYPDPVYRAEVIRFIQRAEGVWGNFNVRRKDGIPRHMLWATMRLVDRRMVGIGMDITESIRLQEALRQSVDMVRSLTTRLSEIEESERQRLSHELHDQVGQELTALLISLNLIRNMLQEQKLPPALAQLNDAIHLVQQTHDHIRQIMADLTPPMLDEFGLLATLGWFADQFSTRTGIQTRVIGDEIKPPLPTPIAIPLYRIVQEALTNIAKHAQASQATIELHDLGQYVRLIITDDGQGFEPELVNSPDSRSGWGLRIMRERALSIGGSLQIQSEPGLGTQILVESPK